MTSISLRFYRALARAFPYDFKNAYGDQLEIVTEEAIDGIRRRYGLLGLAGLLLDLAVRVPAEHLAELWQDLRYGLRMLAGSPGFTAVALVSLTLGIGVATSAFSEMNGFVLRDVPAVAAPERLVTMAAPASYPAYQRYGQRPDLFSGTLAYMAPVPFGVELGGHTERTWGHLVTVSYFDTLGVRPALGRFFGAAESQPGGPPNLVVSDRFWRNHLGGDPAALGRALRINGQPCTLIGVAPSDFQGASPLIYGADLWLPVSVSASVVPEVGDRILEDPERAVFHVVARLRPGVTPARAEAALDAITRQIEHDGGKPNWNQPGRHATILPGGKLIPMRQQDLPLITGFFAVLGGMILLIASSNVANMMLARAAERRKEIAIRLALGAGRARLIRQLLTESLLVSAAAGVLGFGMASAVMRLATQEKLPWPMPLHFDLSPDARVLGFTVALALFTGLAFGLAPALQATRTDLTTALKEGGAVRLRRFRRLSLRNLLVVTQVTGSLALLLITGFLVIGHRRMVGGEVGFDPQNLYLLSLDPVRDGYTAERATDFFHKLLDRVQTLPGITAASLADAVPMTMIGKAGLNFRVPDSQADSSPNAVKAVFSGQRYVVGYGFFETIGIPIVRGRGFRKEDETSGRAIAIISEKLVRDCWHGQDPLGRQIEIGTEWVPSFAIGSGGPRKAPQLAGTTQVLEVVGVAGDVRDGVAMVAANAPPVIYVPLRPKDYARPTLQGVTLLLRAAPGGDPLGAVRREIASMDDRLTPFNPRRMTDQIDEVLFPVQVALWTYGLIGVFGLILASVGIAGVTAYAVTQRRREIGIRVALGARAGDVLGLVMKEGLVLIAVGSAIGLLAARAGIRAMASLLAPVAQTAGTSMDDPALLIGAPLLLAILALGACYVPARRSMAVDPAVTLRQE